MADGFAPKRYNLYCLSFQLSAIGSTYLSVFQSNDRYTFVMTRQLSAS